MFSSKYCLVTTLLILFAAIAQAEIRDSVHHYRGVEKAYERTALQRNLRLALLDLPAQQRYSGETKFSSIEFEQRERREEHPVVMQLGQGGLWREIHVKSFNPLNEKSIAWGAASYEHAGIKNIVWNESSDYEFLYPYIAGDSIGGDLQHETYRFSGGYSYAKGLLTLASHFSYRGVLEYRNIDPRPKNTVGDIHAGLSLSLLLQEKWNVGLDFYAKKYKQSDKIDFFSELGSTPIYHFVGLGKQYVRFAGDKTAFYYDGYGFEGILSLLSLQKNGFSGFVSYSQSETEKIILSLNKLPMSQLSTYRLSGNLLYKKDLGDLEFGAAVKPQYSSKTGVEHIFGDPVNNEYPQIASVAQFFYRNLTTTASALLQYRLSPNLRIGVLPQLSYLKEEERYLYPRSLKGREQWIGNLNAELAIARKRNLFRFFVDCFYIRSQNPILILTELAGGKSFRQMEEQNFEQFASSQAGAKLEFSFYFQANKKFCPYVNAAYLHRSYERAINRINAYSLKLGMLF